MDQGEELWWDAGRAFCRRYSLCKIGVCRCALASLSLAERRLVRKLCPVENGLPVAASWGGFSPSSRTAMRASHDPRRPVPSLPVPAGHHDQVLRFLPPSPTVLGPDVHRLRVQPVDTSTPTSAQSSVAPFAPFSFGPLACSHAQVSPWQSSLICCTMREAAAGQQAVGELAQQEAVVHV